MEYKLIISDMDGTLLHDDKTLPLRFYSMLQALKEKGVYFAIASGRSLSAIKNVFDTDLDIDYICENGNYVVSNHQTLYQSIIHPDLVKKVIDFTDGLEDVDIFLCSKDKTYSRKEKDIHPDNLAESMHYIHNKIEVDDLRLVRDDIIKICLCNTNGIARYYETLSLLKGELEVVVSAFQWIDVFNVGNSKGHGVKRLLQHHKIKPEEVICFGDYSNDIEMFELIPQSYATKNAVEELKVLATQVIGSNNEEAVIDKIIELFELKIG